MRKCRNISICPVFSFVVDGKCELWYLQLLKHHEEINVKKKINIEPKLPQKKKLKDQFELVIKLSDESEKVFWIIDLDSILKETKEAKRGERTSLQELEELYAKCLKIEKIIVIVNNPCLEYWFLQHYEQTSKYFATFSSLKNTLQKYLPNYEKKEKYYKNSCQNIYQKLKPSLPIGITNAKKLGKFRFEKTDIGMAEMYKIFHELQIIDESNIFMNINIIA